MRNPFRQYYWTASRIVSDIISCLRLHALRDALARGATRSRLLTFARKSGFSIGDNVEVVSIDRLTVGPGSVIQSKVTLHCGGMDWANGGGGIQIGRNCFVGHGTVLYGAGAISLGDDVLISPNVTIASHGHSYDQQTMSIREQPTVFRPVTIESNVWIGSGAVILPGVRLGSGCIVAAGAVVVRPVPPNTVVGGIPARGIGTENNR